MRKLLLLFMTVSLSFIHVVSQESKPPLDFSVYDHWKSLSAQMISNDAQWVSYEMNPSVGDGVLFLHNLAQNEKISFERGDGAKISHNNDLFVFRVKPFADSVRQSKLDKVKADQMPKDSLVIFSMPDGEMKKWGQLKYFKMPEFGNTAVAFVLEEEKKDDSKAEADSVNIKEEGETPAEKETEKGKKEKPKKKKYDGAKLQVYFPDTGEEIAFEHVTDYDFAKKSGMLAITSIEEDSVNTGRIHLLNLETKESELIWESLGVTKNLTASEDMSQIAFLHSADTTKSKVFSLYYLNDRKGAVERLVDTLTPGMPEGWTVAESGRIRFSKDGAYLFLGTAEKPEPEPEEEEKDSLLAVERVQLDIWHWKDPILQSMQLKRVKREMNKSFQAVVDLKKKAFIQLGTEGGIESWSFSDLGNTRIGLGLDESAYELSNEVNFESFKDVYLFDLKTHAKKLVFENVSFSPRLSPFARFIYWWEPADSNYYAYHLKKEELQCLTKGLPVSFAIDNNDYPQDTRSYGMMGWTEEDAAVYVYDKYDLWKIDPENEEEAANITGSFGRDRNLRLRYTRTNPEEEYLDEQEKYYFQAFNYETKQSGYYQMSLENSQPEQLILGDFSIRLIAKAKDAEKLIWSSNTVQDYPELRVSQLDFARPQKLTETNPQQKDYNWLTVDLVDWMDYEGVRHQGLLYKPENFDPSKKYPMMVYFYRLHSDELHNYISPRASYSTINAAFYASNGYLVFMPDVFFKVTQPGKSSFNSVVSGVMSLGKEFEYIDMERLGIQGQSWGGYQTAYIITQTDLFAAASPGAPVSNMTSAYGGIRTSSGMCRQVQYEQGQSRIGATLWDKPIAYYENSPLFYADQCNTPCLIRHNDNDGAVPFAQGVEFFVALRRLGKPAWLLNYNDGPHNLTAKLSNRKDLSVRMKQFFDYYLKDTPAPEWLTEGVKAVNKKDNETYYMKFAK